jgi:hypothetical protein
MKNIRNVFVLVLLSMVALFGLSLLFIKGPEISLAGQNADPCATPTPTPDPPPPDDDPPDPPDEDPCNGDPCCGRDCGPPICVDCEPPCREECTTSCIVVTCRVFKDKNCNKEWDEQDGEICIEPEEVDCGEPKCRLVCWPRR